MILGKLIENIERVRRHFERKWVAEDMRDLVAELVGEDATEHDVEVLVFSKAKIAPNKWRDMDVFQRRDWLLVIRDQGGQETAASDEETIPDPEPKLIRQLSGNSRSLVEYLWKKGNVSTEQLRRDVWQGKEVTDRAIYRAVEYCNDNLAKLGHTRTKIENRDGLFYLTHPQK